MEGVVDVPTRAPRWCSTPGCSANALPGQAKCGPHAKTARVLPRRRRRTRDQRAPYDTAHQRRSRRARRRQPWCTACGAKASDVQLVLDHIDGDPRNNAPSNHQVLCVSCHATKTNRYDGGFGNRRRARG